mgnify:CR=1 FL=1
MKNMSELMVDLAYSAVLFNSKAAAEEVIALENEVNSMNYEIKKESLVAARSYEDAEKLTAIADVIKGVDPSQTLGLLILMVVVPYSMMILSNALYQKKYKLDEAEYDRICKELEARRK